MSKKIESRQDIDDEDAEWEELIPARFKKVCKGDTWEPFHVSEDKNWW